MSAVTNLLAARRWTWPVYCVPVAVLLAAIGTLATAIQHREIGQSVLLSVVIAASFAASLLGAVGALILANIRRNVMWLLPLSLATTAFMALAAIVLSAMAPV